MTTALCMACGRTKRGALVRCSACSTDHTGMPHLDVLLTDHIFTVEQLEELGTVVERIRDRAPDAEPDVVRFAFISMLADRSEAIKFEINPDKADEIRTLTAGIEFPDIDIDAEIASPREPAGVAPAKGCVVVLLGVVSVGLLFAALLA